MSLVNNRALFDNSNKFTVLVDYSLEDLESRINASKIVVFKFTEQFVKVLSDSIKYDTSREISLNINFDVTFRSGLKRFKLNSKLRSMNHLFVKKPLLTTYTQQSWIHNNRSDSSHFAEASSNDCSVRWVELSSEELGWHGVILEPKWLKFSYCADTCNGRSDKNSAIKVLKCSASQFSSVYFLILDLDNSLLIKRVENLSVESCSCR